MKLPKALLFIDYANINRTARDHTIEVNYTVLRQQVADHTMLIKASCYVPVDPRSPHRFDSAYSELKNAGYIVVSKIGTYTKDSYKCNMDVEITIDIIKLAHQVRPDVVILASGDGDFIPVIDELHRMRIRTEVIAFTVNSSAKLLRRASTFYYLDQYKRAWLSRRLL